MARPQNFSTRTLLRVFYCDCCEAVLLFAYTSHQVSYADVQTTEFCRLNRLQFYNSRATIQLVFVKPYLSKTMSCKVAICVWFCLLRLV